MKQPDQSYKVGCRGGNPNKKPHTTKKPIRKLGVEASTPMPSQGDEPIFILLMALETETHGEHNDSFVLILGMVCKKSKASNTTSYRV